VKVRTTVRVAIDVSCSCRADTLPQRRLGGPQSPCHWLGL
jgi:hypothetical protein